MTVKTGENCYDNKKLYLKLQGHSIMRVMGNGNAVEEQQLEVGQRPIRQEALLVLAGGAKRGEGEHPGVGVQLAILDDVGVGGMV